MPLDYAAIGGRLQARRKELGITQEDAAERVGITVVYLSKIENGRVHPTLDLLDRLCCVLEYDLARAFTGVQTTSPDYGQEQVLRLFNACAPRVKPVVLHLLEPRLVILNAKEQTPRRTTGASSIAFIFLYHKNRKMQEKRG